jgi:hypothetical protein
MHQAACHGGVPCRDVLLERQQAENTICRPASEQSMWDPRRHTARDARGHVAQRPGQAAELRVVQGR